MAQLGRVRRAGTALVLALSTLVFGACARQTPAPPAVQPTAAPEQTEPLDAYLLIAMRQYEDSIYADYYNVGPDDVDCFQTGALVDLFVSKWGEGMKWINKYDGGPHEANFLKLDCSKLKSTFGWTPRWNLDEAMDKIVEWSKIWLAGGDVRECMDKQIAEFLNK